MRRGLEDGYVSTHRVADQHHGLAGHLFDELVDQARVRPDGGRASEERGLSKPCEVDSEGVVVLGDLWSNSHPVQGAPAEAVDHDDRSSGAAEVYVVNRAVEVCDFMPHCVMNATPGSPRPDA